MQKKLFNNGNDDSLTENDFHEIETMPYPIVVQDCFVKYFSKGSGHGESRFHISNQRDPTYKFCYKNYFFITKENLVQYLNEAIDDINKQIIVLKIKKQKKDKIIKVINDIKNSKISIYYFKVKEVNKIGKKKYKSIYIRPIDIKEDIWTYLRTISIPQSSYIIFKKVINKINHVMYYKISLFYDNKNIKDIKHERIKHHTSLKLRRRTNKLKLKNKLEPRDPKWKKDVIELRGNICMLSGITNEKIIIKAHIKPYKNCDSEEKKDPYNGLIMNNIIHKAFDDGMFTFDNNKKIIFYSGFNRNDLKINLNMKSYKKYLDKKTMVYVKWHRENIFKH